MITQTTRKETANTKEQFKHEVGCLRVAETRGSMQTPSQHNADNTTEAGVVITNPTVTGKNNIENSFPSESTNEDTNIFF